MTTVPSIKGIIGDKLYYQCTMNAQDLIARTEPVEEFFSEDEQIIAKLDTFFEQINNFPLWLQGLIVGGYSTVLGIKGVSTFKKK